MLEPVAAAPILAVFASDKGRGDAERASLMSQTGTYFAKRGASIVVLAENGDIPIPLITAARAAGGIVQIIADASITLPPALTGVTMDVLETPAERHARVAQLAEAYVALPGSLPRGPRASCSSAAMRRRVNRSGSTPSSITQAISSRHSSSRSQPLC